MVAESTEIFGPITQLGCAHACAGVTRSSWSTGVVRKGPPEAVSSKRRTPARSSSPARPQTKSRGSACSSAECSLSIGSSRPRPCAIAAMKSAPDMTSASLLARSTSLPARAAASVAGSPAAPTIAAMTTSTASSATMRSSASLPWCTSVASPCARTAAASRSAAAASQSTACAGRKATHCSSSTRSFLPAASAVTRKRSRWRATTSSVFFPIEPVDPKTAIRLMARPPSTTTRAPRSAAWT